VLPRKFRLQGKKFGKLILKSKGALRRNACKIHCIMVEQLIKALIYALIMHIPFFLSIPISHGQKLEEKNRASYTVVNPTHKELIFVQVDEKSIKLKKEITYYWYKRNKVHQTQGDYAGQLLDGEYSAFYRGNQLYQKGTFDRGVKHGVWKYWNKNGRINRTEEWKKGQLHGKVIHYTTQGQDSLMMRYRKGKLKKEKGLEESQNLIQLEVYNESGELKETRSIQMNKDGTIQEEVNTKKPHKPFYKRWFAKKEEDEG
jgi:antitoxin component YwqK of YwqJK toxin-antitoxin module